LIKHLKRYTVAFAKVTSHFLQLWYVSYFTHVASVTD